MTEELDLGGLTEDEITFVMNFPPLTQAQGDRLVMLLGPAMARLREEERRRTHLHGDADLDESTSV